MISKVELVNFKVKPYTENFLPHSKKLQENQQDTFQKQKKISNVIPCDLLIPDDLTSL